MSVRSTLDYTEVAQQEETLLRVYEHVSFGDGCWEWLGNVGDHGYGRMQIKKVRYLAHRLTYELLVGPVEPHLHVDHLCRNKICVRPGHLEPVTPAENVRRAMARTHCHKGHEFSPGNTYIRPNGTKLCRTCERVRAKIRRDREVGA